MKLTDYLRDKISYIIGLITGLIFVSPLILVLIKGAKGIYVCVSLYVVMLVQLIISLAYEYYKKQQFYKNLLDIFDSLDKKNLISDLIEPPEFSEGMIFYDILKRENKACLDEIARYRNMQEEYREYIELWVHEIKTPISSALLLAQNNKNELTESFSEEIEKIQSYVTQALFYSRSNNVNKDYIIKKTSLSALCSSVLQKNAKLFIQNHISIDEEDLNLNVYCDVKWLEYILLQILTNSVKYSRDEDARILLSAEKQGNSVVLRIKDNGIGIAESELSRIFDKGFTGSNGRRNEKSTGMGLYICKKLCDKMGLSISAASKQGEGTSISIIFPKNSLTEVATRQDI